MRTGTRYRRLTPQEMQKLRVRVMNWRERGKNNFWIAQKTKQPVSRVRYLAAQLIEWGLIEPLPQRWSSRKNGYHLDNLVRM